MKLCGYPNWFNFRWIFIAFTLLILPELTFSQNLPPVLQRGIPNQHCEVGSAFSYTIPPDAFRDENNDQLTISPVNLPAWLSYDSATNTLSGTPSSSGETNITVTASDGSKSKSTTFSITAHAESTYAAFTMDYQMGCGYRLVNFTNKSKGASSYSWVLGNGNTSPEKDPSAIYSKAGTYTVTLTINGGGGGAGELTHSETIHIYPRPRPLASEVTETGCEPFDITVQSAGTPVNVSATIINGQNVGSITGGSETYYNWYFFEKHDAVITENKSVNVSGLQGGQYKTVLEVTDEFGCQGSVINFDHFEVYSKPEAFFTYEKSNICEPSLTLFYDQSTVLNAEVSDYNWTIDGTTSSLNNDTISYDFTSKGSGTYAVSLVSQSEHGCSSEPYTETIQFNNDNIADFSTNDSYCAGDTATFTATTSSAAISYQWDVYSDGTIDDTTKTLSYVFNSPGEQTIKLTVFFDDGCRKVITKKINVEQVMPDFNYTVNYNCTNDVFTVSFNDESTAIPPGTMSGYEWYQVKTTSQTLLSTSDNFSHQFNNPGNYNIKLEITGVSGCISSVTKSITLQKPSASFTVAGLTYGCLSGEATTFSASYNSAFDNAVSYEWDFGDGNIGTDKNTSHTYTSAGEYTVQLTVETDESCNFTSTIENIIQLTEKPLISSANLIQSTEKCFSEGIQLEVTSSLLPDTYYYIHSNDEEIISNPGENPYIYEYFPADTGTFEIKIVAEKYGCFSDTFTVSNIEINEPKAKFEPSQSTFCENPPYVVGFVNKSSYSHPSTQFEWDFGDGNSSTEISPTHEYDSTGNYTASLTVRNPVTGCSHTTTEEINIYSFNDASGIITTNIKEGCAPLEVNFSQNIAERLSANYVVDAYEWDFDNDGVIDSTTSSDIITYTYNTPGRYSVRLAVKSSQSCDYDFTETDMITVGGTIVDFEHLPDPVCSGDEIQFTNTTTRTSFDTTNPDNDTFSWNFDDGNTSTDENPTHTYNRDTIYNVTLTVTDEGGCSLTLTRENLIDITPFTPAFELSDTILCDNSEVTFFNTSTGDITEYKWDFDGNGTIDLTTSNNNDVTHNYPIAGIFDAKLIVEVADGCDKEYTQRVRVINATAQFEAEESEIGCAPAFAYFSPQANHDDVLDYYWDFGDGNTSNERNPRNYYVTPGYYTVSLTIVFKGNCSKTVTKTDYIFADGAFGYFDYDNVLGCNPNPVSFSISEMQNVDYITWDFGNGVVEQDTVNGGITKFETTYIYDTLGFITPRVILTDDVCGEYAYQNEDKGSIYNSRPPVAGFTTDYDSICNGVPIHFTDTSYSPDPLYNEVTGWKWDFGTSEDNTSAEQHPAFAYPEGGVYSPQLIAYNEIGCTDTLTDFNRIHIYTNNALSSEFDISETLACPWEKVDFTSQSSAGPEQSIEKYEWNFGDGNQTGSIKESYHFNSSFKGETVTIYHKVTDDKFCTDSTAHTVDISNLQAAFGYEPQPVTRGSAVDYSDESITDPGTSITNWQWSFTGANVNSSIQTNPQNIEYPEILEDQSTQLIVNNSIGCIDTSLFHFDILNNPPTLDTFSIILVENYTYQFNTEEFDTHFEANDPGQTLDSIMVVSAPFNGSFRLNGTSIGIMTPIHVDDIPTLEFIPAPNWNGNTQFLWNGNDGYGWSENPKKVIVTVLEKPDPPILETITFYIPTDSAIKIIRQDFINHVISDLKGSLVFDSLIIKNLPSEGTLTFNEQPIAPPLLILSDEIDNENNVLHYTPENNYSGTVTFNWNAHDGYNFGTSDGLVEIIYYNSAPTPDDIVRYNLKEDATQAFSRTDFENHFNDRDIFDVAQSIMLDSIPKASEGRFYNGSTVLSAGTVIDMNDLRNFRFIPSPGFEGTTIARWGISDGEDFGYAKTILTFENTPPVVNDFYINGYEDQTLSFSTSDFENTSTDSPFTDDDRWDKLSDIVIVTLPENGVLELAGTTVNPGQEISRADINNLIYLPNTDWNETDTFKYNAKDGSDMAENDATVFIVIETVNDAPRPNSDYYTIYEDEVLSNVSVADNDNDIDNPKSDLSYHVEADDSASAGQNGNIVLNSNGDLTYTPNPDFNGNVYFVYTVCDLELLCATDTVFINIVPVNDAPRAIADTFHIVENEEVTNHNFIDNDYEVDGDDFRATHVNSDTIKTILSDYGLLVWIENGDITFTLNEEIDTLAAGESVQETFIYTVIDDSMNISTSTFTIIIEGLNNPPVASDNTFTAYENFEYIYNDEVNYPNILSNDTDPENDNLYIENVNNSTQKEIATDYGIFRWETDGSWSFTEDSIETNPIPENTIVQVDMQYTISDGVATSNQAYISLRIIGENDAPSAINDTLIIYEDAGTVSFEKEEYPAMLVNDYDVDEGDQIWVSKINNSSNKYTEGILGALIWNDDGSFSYTPNRDTVIQLGEGEQAIDIFNYRISDNNLIADAQFIVIVKGRNDKPFAEDDYITIYEDTHRTEIDSINGLLANDGDIDQDPIIVAVNDEGTRAISGIYGMLTWEPSGAFMYETFIKIVDTLYHNEIVYDRFTYQVVDPSGETDQAQLEITIVGENDAPVAIDHYESMFENDLSISVTERANGILAEDSDIDDNDNFGIIEVEQQSEQSIAGIYGTLEWNYDGEFTYMLNSDIDSLAENEVVIDSFLYTIEDAFDSTAFARLYIEITGNNSDPQALNDKLRVNENQISYAPEWSLLDNDYDIDGDNIQMYSLNNETNTTINSTYALFTWDSLGYIEYKRHEHSDKRDGLDTLAWNDLVRDSIPYSITDEIGSKSEAYLHLEISGKNDAPIANRDSSIIDESTEFVYGINMLENDYDIDRNDTISLHNIAGQTNDTHTGIYGTLTLETDGTYTYQNNFEATDSLKKDEIAIDLFPYTIIDSQRAKSSDTLVIKIIGENDDPIAVNDTMLIYEDESVKDFKSEENGVLWNDYDADNDSIWVLNSNNETTETKQGKYGSLTLSKDGSASYQLNSEIDTLSIFHAASDVFEYTITDIHDATSSAQFVINIQGENDPPVATDIFISILEHTDTIYAQLNSDSALLTNAYDIDNDTIFVESVNNNSQLTVATGYGEMQWDTTGAYLYINNRELTAPIALGDTVYDYIPFVVADNFAGIDTALLTIEIIGQNDAPVALPNSFYTEDRIPLKVGVAAIENIMNNDYDIDGEVVQIISMNGMPVDTIYGNWGTLVWKPNGSLEYLPDSATAVVLKPGEYITDEFIYTIEDNHGATDTSVINIDIIGINNGPTSYNDTLLFYGSQILEPKDINVLANDIDPEDDTLYLHRIEGDTTGIFTESIYGEIEWKSDGNIRFIPDSSAVMALGPNQQETVHFEYFAIDSAGAIGKAYIVVKLIGENDPVTAINDYTEIDEDTYLAYNVVENDIDPDENFDFGSLSIETQPFNGKAYVNSSNGVMYYYPNKNFNGIDSLQYRICDEGFPVYCDMAWLIIDVIPMNDPPVATHLILQTNINTPVDFNYFNQVEDIDDGINPTSLILPEDEKVKTSGDSTIVYTPATDSTGIDEFIYSLADFDNQRAYVIVNVIVQDDGYGAQDDYATTSQHTPVDIAILENDTINGFKANPLSSDIKIFPTNGTASYNPQTRVVSYRPDDNFNGTDSLFYTVQSYSGNFDYAKVVITVEPTNNPVVANDDAVTTYIERDTTIRILDNDYDLDDGIDSTSIEIISEPQHGLISINHNKGRITYIPEADYRGNDSLSYKICDLNEDPSCDSATVYILVRSKFDDLNAKNDSCSTFENETKKIYPLTNDKYESLTSFDVITEPLHGTFAENDDSVITYTPNDNFNGPDWMTYQICNDDGCDFAEINIWVEPKNTAPVANDDSYVVSENTNRRLYILANDYDTDGTLDWNTLDTVAGMGPRMGDIEFNRETGTILYQPRENSATDQFLYIICDNEGECDDAMVTIDIDLGSIIFHHIETNEDTPFPFDLAPIMANFNLFFDITDAEEVVAAQIGNWELTEGNTQLTYTPMTDSTGSDYFNIILLSDDEEINADLRVTVDVIPVNDAPVAMPDTIVWNMSNDTTIIAFNDLLNNDFDVDSDSILLATEISEYANQFEFFFNEIDSTIQITSTLMDWCDTWFIYEISDNEGLTDTAFVNIFPDFDVYKPVAVVDSFEVPMSNAESTAEDLKHLLDVLANDTLLNNQRCTIDSFAIITPPVYGEAFTTDDKNIIYVPEFYYDGSDSLQYLITDRWQQTDSAWVYIDVLFRNIPPVAQNDNITLEPGQTALISILENDYDPDPYPFGYIDTSRTYLLTDSLPQYGTAQLDPFTGTVTYIPAELSCDPDKFTYVIFDNYGDSATATVFIGVPDEGPLNAVTDTVKTWPNVPVDFNVLENDNGYFLPYVELYTNPYAGSVSQTGDSTFIYYPTSDFVDKDSMTYTLVSPCGNTKTGKVIFMVEELRVPEIITPNNDTKNDVLIIDGIEYYPDSWLRIYNRYGHVVYEKRGYENDWDGYSNRGSVGGDRPLPSGTYYYTLIYNEEKNRQAGFIYIFR
jgi:gliding motility-associated-like protein